MSLRSFLDRAEPMFSRGGRFEKFYALYEAVDTFLYSPPTTTYTAPHVRDGIDLKRMMSYVVLATIPCIIIGCLNAGYQSNQALQALGQTEMGTWRDGFMSWFGHNPDNPLSNLVLGLSYFLPVYFVTVAVGGFWEVVFATVRKHEINEGFLVTSMLYALILPPDIPLWQVALGISFGVIVAKEVFGGTGKNFLNPALAGRAFLFFAYPGEISGDAVWVGVDGYTQATALAVGAVPGVTDSVAAIHAAGYSWWQAFFGFIPGSMGEVSTAAILLGAAFLIYTGVASWRIIAGVFLGMVVTSIAFNFFAVEALPLMTLPWYWHLVVGGFAFGMVFMATDPVSASHSDAGRWVFGALIGFMTVLIRAINPAYPEGIMLAILFSNLFAPLIDYVVVQLNIKRRRMRNAKI